MKVVTAPVPSQNRGIGFLFSLPMAIRFAFVGLVVLSLSYLPYRIMSDLGDRKLQDMNTELHRVKAELEKGKSENSKRRRRVQALKTDTRMIEKIARQDLHMLYPHEKTLHISNPGRGPKP